MKKRAIIAVAVLLLLMLKYFFSALPMLPANFFSTPLYVDDLNFHTAELKGLGPKLLVWLDFYLSVPGSLPSWMPSSGVRGAELRFGEEDGSFAILYDADCFGAIFVAEGDQLRSYLSPPGMGESLHYLAWDYWKAGLTERPWR